MFLFVRRECGADRVAQVEECLPSKCEALSSDPQYHHIKKREGVRRECVF
jgi:hypothetical protein